MGTFLHLLVYRRQDLFGESFYVCRRAVDLRLSFTTFTKARRIPNQNLIADTGHQVRGVCSSFLFAFCLPDVRPRFSQT